MAGHIHKGLDIGVFGLMANSDTTHCSSRRDTCSAMFTESEHISPLYILRHICGNVTILLNYECNKIVTDFVTFQEL